MRQKWSPDFLTFLLVLPVSNNCEPFAPKPKHSGKCEPFQANAQMSEPFPVFGKAVPESVTPLRTFAKSANRFRIRVQSTNHFEVSASTCSKVRTLCESSPKVLMLSTFWRTHARKCEPFLGFGGHVPKVQTLSNVWRRRARKCEPLANLRHKCERTLSNVWRGRAQKHEPKKASARKSEPFAGPCCASPPVTTQNTTGVVSERRWRPKTLPA